MYINLIISPSQDVDLPKFSDEINKLLVDFKIASPLKNVYYISCDDGDCRSYIHEQLVELKKLGYKFDYILSPYYLSKRKVEAGFHDIDKNLETSQQLDLITSGSYL